MKDLDLSKIKKVFFVGIGGIGISAIARMMYLEGKEVSGSDMAENELTNELKKLGIEITIGQSFELIPTDADLIVYTIAIPHYDIKLFEQIKNSNIVYKNYPEMLGVITADKYTIAVAGTHGKTTTTAMIAKILIDAKLDPTVIVGSLLNLSHTSGQEKSNLVVGKSKYFIVEACEYERSFLNLKPKLLVITNIDKDHLDYYKDLDDIKNAFSELSNQSENVITDYSKYIEKATASLGPPFGGASPLAGRAGGAPQHAVVPKLAVPGAHNRQNAAAAYVVAEFLGIKKEIITKSLAEFSGTWRRLEKRGQTPAGTIIYDDYAHHPTEIKASIEALRELYPTGRKNITIIFQPHLYSRTKALFDDFSKCFKGVDRVFLLPIYFAREDKDENVSSEKLAEAINKAGEKAEAFSSFTLAENFIKTLNLGQNDVFVTMGAGEAYKVADKVFKML